MTLSFQSAVESYDFASLKTSWCANPLSEFDKKTEAEFILRSKLMSLLSSNASDDNLLRVISFVIQVIDESVKEGAKEWLSKTFPVVLLSDVFDCSTIDRCERLFRFVEERTSLWKSATYFDACKNHLLRMCNDLLRRLSRSVDVTFCGRILVFLAQSLPLTEKSGLNPTSQFNEDNVTRYDEQDDVASAQPEVELKQFGELENMSRTDDHETDSSLWESNDDLINHLQCTKMFSGRYTKNYTYQVIVLCNSYLYLRLIPIDYNMYRRFWQLQTVFSMPLLIYDKIRFNSFKQNANEVLAALSSYKLEDMRYNGPSSEVPGIGEADYVKVDQQPSKEVYFAKYLTSQKLLQLQLNDANFRRYVLVQFLILFQYLRLEVKTRDSKKFRLTDDQNLWVHETINKVFELLRETPPEGRAFSETIKHILKREEYWNNWKNNGCEDYTQKAVQPKMPLLKRKARPKYTENEIDLANPELTRLWKICPDNFEACKDTSRQFEPTLESYFEDSFEQLIPENQVEEQYRLINDEKFQWRAFRLLSRKKENFFETKNLSLPLDKDFHKSTYLKQFLQQHITDVGEKMLKFQNKKVETKPEETSSTDVATTDVEVESNVCTVAIVDDSQIKALAALVGPDWTKLAKHLGFNAEDITANGTDSDAEVACCNVLTDWRRRQASEATTSALQEAFIEAEMFNEDVAAVLSSFDSSDMVEKSRTPDVAPPQQLADSCDVQTAQEALSNKRKLDSIS